MRIAIFYHIQFSGAKRVVQEHTKGLVSFRNTVDIYTTDNAKDIFDPGIYASNKFYYEFSPKSINFPVVKRIKSDFYDTFLSLKILHKKIAKDIDKRNYDIVLVHTDINTQAPFLLKFLKTKNVYFCLEPLRNAYEYSLRLKDNVSFLNKFYEDLNRTIRKKIDLKNALSANNILTLSLFARERIIAAYDLYPKISYLGVNEKVFKPKNIKKIKQVFFVAEKYSIYGYDLAKEAINLIPQKIRPNLKIVSWTKHNGDRLSDEELSNIYNQSIATLSLSRFDTFGLVPLESMSCGIPVIALNVAGYRETIKDKETGFLVDYNAKEISEKIMYFLNNPDKAKEFGENGRRWIGEKWTWEKQISKLNSLLEELIAEK
ncbi:MAG: glycosyltransferase family 4 protein [Patescibacteria group bacterium]